jgi:hypothetical protein
MWCAVSGPLRCVVRFSTNFSYKLVILPLLNEKAELLLVVPKKNLGGDCPGICPFLGGSDKACF